jgi:hypothetical protein
MPETDGCILEMRNIRLYFPVCGVHSWVRKSRSQVCGMRFRVCEFRSRVREPYSRGCGLYFRVREPRSPVCVLHSWGFE